MRTLIVAATLLAIGGADAPAGYTIVPDKASADLSKAVYTASGGNWDVTTGPAHIIFSDKDAATGSYAVSATIEQLAKPAHPEAYGLFLGGKDLADTAKRTYTYFVVRGTGEYLVKVMNGSKTTTVTNWTANENIPKEDANGKASYALKVHVAPTAFHFFVNGKMVAEVPRGMNPAEGIAGLRINHNLHLLVTMPTIAR
jgi:hypothetical protein